MSLRTILVPLSGTAQDRRPMLHAIQIAKQVDAHVTMFLPGGHLSELVPTRPGGAPVPSVSSSIVREAQNVLARRASDTRRLFEQVAQESGATMVDTPVGASGGTISFESRDGDDNRLIQEAAVYHDLILFHRDLEGSAGLEASEKLKTALQSSGRPLLVVPIQPPESLGITVTIAWNGSIEGAHAVSAAAPIIDRASSVHILTAATPKTDVQKGEMLRSYLVWRGVDATVHPVEPSGESVGGALLSKAVDISTSLLVMGGYSHSRLRQTMLGGVTHHVLRHATIPVLLSR